MNGLKRILLVLLAGQALAVSAADEGLPPFFDELKADGSWIRLAETAWAWQPAAMQQDLDWRPYLHAGSWTRNEENWFWTSAYAWGAIAFHYGRWFETEEYGWLWVPGAQWSPAWVDWRLTPTHSGWAPLPPGDAFFASIGVTNAVPGWDQYAFVHNAVFLSRELLPFAADGTAFAGATTASYTGPEPEQVGYVATPVTTVSVPAATTIYTSETSPVYTETHTTTVYVREPVFTACRAHGVLGHGARLHDRGHPASPPPVRIRRANRSRPPAPPPAVKRPAPPSAVKRPAPPSAVKRPAPPPAVTRPAPPPAVKRPAPPPAVKRPAPPPAVKRPAPPPAVKRPAPPPAVTRPAPPAATTRPSRPSRPAPPAAATRQRGGISADPSRGRARRSP